MAVVTNSPAFIPSHPPVPVTGGVTGGQLIHRVDPTYPELAKRMGKKGSVVIAGVVNRAGVMENLRVISGDPLLTGAAITAVRQWRFDPYRLTGNAVEAATRVVVTFKD
jgi:protein TonB